MHKKPGERVANATLVKNSLEIVFVDNRSRILMVWVKKHKELFCVANVHLIANGAKNDRLSCLEKERERKNSLAKERMNCLEKAMKKIAEKA